MKLYVVRHGIAIEHGTPKCPADSERFLTEEGLEKAKQAAEGVAAIGAQPDLCLSSPYVRAVQTAEIFAGVLEYPKEKIRKTEQLLPGAEPLLLIRELAQERATSTIFLFGHAPQLDEVIAAVLNSKKQLTSLKKAGVALIELPRVSPPSGELVWLCTPKILRRAGK